MTVGSATSPAAAFLEQAHADGNQVGVATGIFALKAAQKAELLQVTELLGSLPGVTYDPNGQTSSANAGPTGSLLNAEA
jgi:hypothetical protein